MVYIAVSLLMKTTMASSEAPKSAIIPKVARMAIEMNMNVLP